MAGGAYVHIMKMTRTSITFAAPQLKFLRREATKLGISVAELVRRIVDGYRLWVQPEELRKSEETKK